MSNEVLWSVAQTVNRLLKDTELAHFHSVRKKLRGKHRRAATELFSYQSRHDGYVLHYGGRGELQFNIGWDTNENGEPILRFGVAFSFDRSRWVYAPKETLLPKIGLFNDYMAKENYRFSDLEMWYYGQHGRSSNSTAGVITDGIIDDAAFIFIGTTQPESDIDYDHVVEVFLRLYAIYLYIESQGERDAVKPVTTGFSFDFVAGNSVKRSDATGSRKKTNFRIALRHNDLQEQLYNELAAEYGENSVGTECKSNAGGYIDLVVLQRNESGAAEYVEFYEIKTAGTAKECIRQALGQMLEYSYYDSGTGADELIVVGEPKLTAKDEAYLARLREQLNIPLSYRPISRENVK